LLKVSLNLSRVSDKLAFSFSCQSADQPINFESGQTPKHVFLFYVTGPLFSAPKELAKASAQNYCSSTQHLLVSVKPAHSTALSPSPANQSTNQKQMSLCYNFNSSSCLSQACSFI